MRPWPSCAGSLYPNENPGTSPSVFDELSPFPLLRRRSDGRDPRLQPTDEVVFVGASSPPLPRMLLAGSPPVERRLPSLLRGSQSMPRVLYMAVAALCVEQELLCDLAEWERREARGGERQDSEVTRKTKSHRSGHI